MDKDLIYKIAINMIPKVGPMAAKQLISYCGSVEAVFKEPLKALEKIPSIGRTTAQNIIKQEVLSAAEFEMRFMEQNGIKALYYQDAQFPFRLKQCPDSPILLYQQGDCNLNTKKVVSIVGTRASTDYGEDWTVEFVKQLSNHDILLVSGLAYGIDICAHKSALDNNIPTIGVLGHGLDRIYPAKHTQFAKDMLNRGALLSEFTSGNKPNRENFPKRNRIVAGMSDAIVVVEAKKRGGALITADLGFQYNRDVFALPGNYNQSTSEGCNHLIKTTKANLIESIEDLKYIMNWTEDTDHTITQDDSFQTELFIHLSQDEEEVLDVLMIKAQPIDLIAIKVKIPISRLIQILLQLELKGLIKNLPGNQYKRL